MLQFVGMFSGSVSRRQDFISLVQRSLAWFLVAVFCCACSSRAFADQTPYSKTAATIPGVVQAENFDNGGQGIAYHDTTPGNQGGQYRNTDVDIFAGGSTFGSQFCVGNIAAGEWLEYTVNVTSPGTYQIDIVVSSNSKGGKIHLSVDGVNKTGQLTLPNTGGLDNWTTLTKTGVAMPGGTHVLRLMIDSSADGGNVGNVDYFQFTKTGSGSSDNGFHPNPLTWNGKATNPVHREEAQSLVYNGRLYELGGYDANFDALTRVDAYDPVANKWSRLHDLPYGITHAAVAPDPDGHTFWFIGGFLGSFTHDPPVGPPATAIVYKYNAASDSWAKGPSLPFEHGAGGAGLVNNKLYFFGGADKTRTKDLNDVYELDLSNQSAGWKRVGSLPNPRNHLGGITVAGKIYAIGGQHFLEDKSVMQSEVDQFDPATGKWSSVASLPTALSHFNASTVLYNRYIITVGGENPHNTAKPYVFAYDTVLNKWAQLSNLPEPRRAGVAGVIGNLLIQSSGYRQSESETSTTWTADLSNVFT